MLREGGKRVGEKERRGEEWKSEKRTGDERSREESMRKEERIW